VHLRRDEEDRSWPFSTQPRRGPGLIQGRLGTISRRAATAEGEQRRAVRQTLRARTRAPTPGVESIRSRKRSSIELKPRGTSCGAAASPSGVSGVAILRVTATRLVENRRVPDIPLETVRAFERDRVGGHRRGELLRSEATSDLREKNQVPPSASEGWYCRGETHHSVDGIIPEGPVRSGPRETRRKLRRDSGAFEKAGRSRDRRLRDDEGKGRMNREE